jgi:hypothetical protein
MRPDPRLTDALIQILNGTELALSTIAAWALGRIGDQAARSALCQALDSPYHSIRAYSVRALGALGDTSIIPLLTQRLDEETDKGLQMAYASALGNLKARDTAAKLLSLLRSFENEGARMELALSVARLVGAEGRFIRLVREARSDPGTTSSQVVTALRRKLVKEWPDQVELMALFNKCADSLAHNELAGGAKLMSQAIGQLPLARFEATSALILRHCAENLAEFGEERQEYMLLALHTLEAGWLS